MPGGVDDASLRGYDIATLGKPMIANPWLKTRVELPGIGWLTPPALCSSAASHQRRSAVDNQSLPGNIA